MPISVKSRNASRLTACFFMASAAASVAPAYAADSIMEERFAQDAPLVQNAVPGFEFELGGGVSTQPSFEGSDRYTYTGFPIFHFGYLRLENGFSLGGGDGTGFGIAPSFRYLGARKAKDDPALLGLYDIDAAVELGAGLSYAWDNARIFGDVRYGAIGHHAFVGEVGADAIMRPLDDVTLSFGPRASFASAKYNQTYFGVTGPESTASGLSAFKAGAGFKSVGVAALARYDFAQNWAVETGAGYNRLVGDAGKSPVTALGSRDQYRFTFGLVRSFSMDF